MQFFTSVLTLNLLIAAGFTVVLSACKPGSDYAKPIANVPESYKELVKEWHIAKPRDEVDRGLWWTIFNNPALNALEEKLNKNNFNIALAEAHYREAYALIAQARANYFPTVTGTVSNIRAKQPPASVTQNAPANRPTTTHLLSFAATWEPDLWGGIRRSVEASTANAEASAAQWAGARLSAQALLAQSYFQLCLLDTNQHIFDKTIKTYQKSLQLIKNQHAAGVVSQIEVMQAENQLHNTTLQAADNAINRTLYEHAIAVLIGEAPSGFSLPLQTVALQPPPIPVDAPSVLLERRPDIATAERLMAQANAQIGIASSAYFPTLTLTGIEGRQSNHFQHWLSQPSAFWSLGPQLAATFLDGGLRKAAVSAAKANYEGSIASYRQTILSAFQEVEDNLATLRILQTEAGIQNKVVKNADLNVKMVTNQYRVGTVGYLDVLNAQAALYSEQQSAATLAGRRMTAAVGLIQALGGGW